MLFVGTHEHTIDAKQRLAIPREFREELEAEAGRRKGSENSDAPEACETLYAAIVGGVLCFYPPEVFKARADELDRSDKDPEQVLKYERMFYSFARKVEIDKQGRVRIPDHLLGLVKLGRDVAVIGVKDHMQVLDRDEWLAEQRRVIEENPMALMNPRMMMKQTGPSGPGGPAGPGNG